jgi:hypothetical protein
LIRQTCVEWTKGQHYNLCPSSFSHGQVPQICCPKKEQEKKNPKQIDFPHIQAQKQNLKK